MTESPVVAFRAIISSLELKDDNGTWTRAIPLAYLGSPPPGFGRDAFPNPLWPGGTHLVASRYIPKGMCDAYHISDDASTAMAEAEALPEAVTDPVFGVPRKSMALLRVEWRLTGILDLCDVAVRGALSVPEAELVSGTAVLDAVEKAAATPPSETVTHSLGRAAFLDERVSAIRYPSARRKGGRNIVVFTDRVTPQSGQFLQTRDDTRDRTWRLPALVGPRP